MSLVDSYIVQFFQGYFFFSPIWMTTFAATFFLVVMKIFIHENKPRNASVHTGAGLLFMHVDVNSQREHCKLQGHSLIIYLVRLAVGCIL